MSWYKSKRKIRVNKIVLHYTCEKCGEVGEQLLCDVCEVGTAICPECDMDMELDEFATEID